MIIDFVKMTGAGNDFVLIDNRSGQISLPWETLAPVICERRYGAGADGMLILEQSEKADFLMKYYNADGSSGGMCGNGGRCASLYVMDERKSTGIKFEALRYVYSARKEGAQVILTMKDPISYKPKMMLDVNKENIQVNFIDSGSPHAVIYLDTIPLSIVNKLEGTGFIEIGSLIRHHPRFFPEGTNVDFVKIMKDGTVSMRTYERGVEDETLACGTGAVASAVISSLLHNIPAPVRVRCKSNEILTVNFQQKGTQITQVELTGSAKITYHGKFPYMEKGSAIPRD